MNIEDLVGLVPAAGAGTRLNLPFPKELYPTLENDQYKPVANHVVDNLLTTGLKHIVFVINESKHQFIGYFGSGMSFGCNFTYVIQEQISTGESTSPGLADALTSAYHLIREKIVLFGMADTIMWPKNAFQVGLRSMNQEIDVLLCLFPTKFPEKFGMVSFDQKYKVNQIIDKPQSTDLEFMWGCIIWKPVFSEYLYSKVRKQKISDFAKIMNMAIEDGLNINAVKFEKGKFLDFGTFEQIKQHVNEFGLNLSS